MSTMIAKFDGYLVAERLLEGVMFNVHLKEEDGDVVFVKVTDPDDDDTHGYLANIRTENFHSDIAKRVQEDLEHLRKVAKDENKTIVQLFDEWEAEGYDRASLVMEV